MKRLLYMVPALALVACASTSPEQADGSPATGDAAVGADAAVPASDGGAGDPLDVFFDDVTNAICGALFRCCNDSDLTDYFAPHLHNDRFEALWPQMPPNAEMNEGQCRATVGQMLRLQPFGDWVAAARAGRVTFDAGKHQQCLAALNGASCGASVRAALFDSQCFGFAAPVGGDRQRSMFKRTAVAGAACTPIRDGVGASFYGTCDPARAFCCYADPANPELGCTYPFEGESGQPRAGVCQAVAADGAACNPVPPFQFCATGSDCDSYDAVCVPDNDTPLQVGDVCVDNSFNTLGQCVDSWCDLIGTGACTARKVNGDACTAGYECTSGYCDETCGPNNYCSSNGAMPAMDAGVPDGGVADAGVPDAPATPDAPVAGSGETCAGAVDLMAASSASSGSYSFEVTDSFAVADDYNPLDSSGKAPGCSLVYDAVGKDKVYEVTLQPGQTLRLRFSAAPNTAKGGVYLLDDCASGSWPDYDGSSLCGSNEYATQFCGVVGCDPATLNFTYPTMLDGAATTTKTFYVVADQVGAADATGFTLEWSID